MKRYNLNSHMYIQISDKGWKHLRKTVGDDYIKHCIRPYAKEVNGETWHKLQCHSVFSLFPITYGYPSIINTNVMFDDNALNEVDCEQQLWHNIQERERDGFCSPAHSSPKNIRSSK